MAAVRIDAIRTINYASITNPYIVFGAALTKNWRIFKITNNTDGDMLFSVDATTDNLFVPANSFTLYDLATNAANVRNSDWFVMQIGTQFYIKYNTVPTTRDVWLEGMYSTGV
jgi:hypothetical protein